MAVTEVYNMKKEKIGEVDLNDSIFGVEVKPYIIHDIVRMQLACRRSGTASTKTRAEVRGTGAKPWRQKGTGRARAGSRRSPLWRGGGTTFGPKPRDYSYKIPKKVRRLGLCMALSSRFSEENLMVIDDFQLAEIKTKGFVEVMNNFDFDNALIITAGSNENLERSSRNVPGFKVMPTTGLNVYDILLHRKIMLTKESLGQLEERLLS
ncbi:MAG: 50S ribosomal protein L4 [Proteobacteria bacterium]|nr:50S ribosomal protein L4 [Pseudomonadota bacterium]MBU1686017.1 50S ribosomal protein L4 [Pseudomonadota bacterium]